MTKIADFVCECGQKPRGFQDKLGKFHETDIAAQKARYLFCNACGRGHAIIAGYVTRLTKEEEFEVRVEHAEFLSQHDKQIKEMKEAEERKYG